MSTCMLSSVPATRARFWRIFTLLLVDVLAAQLFAAVLIGGYAGHDGVGGEGIVGLRWLNEDSEEEDR